MKTMKAVGYPKLTYTETNESHTVGLLSRKSAKALVGQASDSAMSGALFEEALHYLHAQANEVEVAVIRGKKGAKCELVFAVRCKTRVAVIAPREYARDRLANGDMD